MKMVGYVRVSTDAQHESGHGLSAQRDAIQREADRRGWEVVWIEDAASGKDLNRIGLAYALNLLHSGEVAGISVSRLDRLSRSVLDFATLLKQAKDAGWNLVVLDLGLDLSTPYGEFGATMLMAAAQLERQLISVRTKEALAAARSRGILPGRRSILPDPIVQRISVEAADGRSMASIAQDLTADAVPLPSGVSGAWQSVQVRRVLGRLA